MVLLIWKGRMWRQSACRVLLVVKYDAESVKQPFCIWFIIKGAITPTHAVRLLLWMGYSALIDRLSSFWSRENDRDWGKVFGTRKTFVFGFFQRKVFWFGKGYDYSFSKRREKGTEHSVLSNIYAAFPFGKNGNFWWREICLSRLCSLRESLSDHAFCVCAPPDSIFEISCTFQKTVLTYKKGPGTIQAPFIVQNKGTAQRHEPRSCFPIWDRGWDEFIGIKNSHPG